MLNSEFKGIAGDDTDYYPVELRAEIDRMNEFTYANINNGVYRTGFATSQASYEAAYDKLFAALDELEARLGRQRYLVGHRITEADWRLFPTLLRFDVAYFSLFKCNRQRIADYPNLTNYMRELYAFPGVARDRVRAPLRHGLLLDQAAQSQRHPAERNAGDLRRPARPRAAGGVIFSQRA